MGKSAKRKGSVRTSQRKKAKTNCKYYKILIYFYLKQVKLSYNYKCFCFSFMQLLLNCKVRQVIQCGFGTVVRVDWDLYCYHFMLLCCTCTLTYIFMFLFYFYYSTAISQIYAFN